MEVAPDAQSVAEQQRLLRGTDAVALLSRRLVEPCRNNGGHAPRKEDRRSDEEGFRAGCSEIDCQRQTAGDEWHQCEIAIHGRGFCAGFGFGCGLALAIY